MTMNFVKITWRVNQPHLAEDKRRKILQDSSLSWAAKGLGCHLTLVKEAVRFPNTIWDGTMDALEELKGSGYIAIKEVLDSEMM